MPPSDTAAFFLPGLIHQFGNLLLTAQGQVLQMTAERIPDVQRSVLGVVKRGAASLQVVRALIGEQTGAPGNAGELLAQLAELGRVPAREHGVTLTLRQRGEPPTCWVRAEPFVVGCGDAIRRWIEALPTGSEGEVGLWLERTGDGDAAVQLTFEPDAGSLPFPLPVKDVADRLGPGLGGTGDSVRIRPDGKGLELRFAAGSVSMQGEA